SIVETYCKNNVPTGKNSFDYQIFINNTEHISNTLNLPVTILGKATIEGRYDDASGELLSDMKIPSFNIGTSKFENGNILIDNKDEKMNLNLNVTHSNKNGLHNTLNLTSDIGDDKIDLKLKWSNDKTEKYEAEIEASTLFVKDTDTDGFASLRTEITIPPAQIIMKDSVWHIDPASVTITNGNINIDNFYLTKGEQFLHLDGIISNNPKEKFFLDMKDIEISYIFDVLNIPALRFGGLATGDFYGRDLLGSMMIEGRLGVQDFSFNQVVQGRLSLSSDWDNDSLAISLLGSIYKNDTTWTDVNGYIVPVGANQGLTIHFDANDIDIAFMQRYMNAFASDVKGSGFGHVHLHGNFSDIYIEGSPYIRVAGMKVNILNTSYSFSDTLVLAKDYVRTKQTAVLDRDSTGTGILDFTLHHNSFRDLKYELDINANKMLVYDVSQTANPKIYGKVYATGQTKIKGGEDNILVEGNARCEAGTSIGFNFMNGSKANDYDFISFVEHRQNGDTTTPVNSNGNDHSTMDYKLDIRVNATPDAKIELTINPAEGEKLTGEGNGDIQVIYGNRNDLQLFGNYLITDGTYNFNLQQVVRKRFKIRDGSTVSFSGDPMAAILDIKALYSLAANIQDLDETLIMETGTPTIPVNCILKLDGRLQNPGISFDLELPNSNSELERQVRSFIDTEDMMTRQIIYLLVLSKFYTPDYSRNTYTGDEFSAMASSALSSQLSNLLGTITDKVQIGTNIRSRQDGIKDTEVEMLLSSKLLNNRLQFNGNFGYKDNYIQSNAFIGEFDLEYKLTRSGEISLKAYNHANDLYRYNTKSLTRQGVGLMFRKDFNTLSDIFKTKTDSIPSNR
ncbi:MAG: translocation/assembly module TamB, partial [Tannerella sp.]|nr:translocation/assembly module TamB [Tannerella sp.]